MAYREVQMWEILNVLRRIGRGESKSAVARVTGHERRTVRRYVKAAEELGWVPGVHEADEVLAQEVYQCVRPGAPQEGPGAAEEKLLPYREQLVGWLKAELSDDERLKLTKAHDLLRRQGIEVSYASLRRFALKYCGYQGRRRVTVRLEEVPAGDVAQVDFGRLGLIEVEPGKRRVVHALIVTLVHSRHQYVHVTHSQKLPDLIEGLEDAWEFFGGVVARVILDNLKAAVTKADRYDPLFQRVFEEYADYRGFVIDAAVVGSPTHKPHVERSVQYVRESFFKGERWLGLEHVQRAARTWVVEVAGMREHGTTKRRPIEVFEEHERNKLQPLVRDRFDPPTWRTDAKVHPDHMVTIEGARYTVPTKYVDPKTRFDIRADSKLVRIYIKGELVKTHERKPAGGRSIDFDDYPQHQRAYARRDPDRMIREGKDRGTQIGAFMESLLAGDFPWAKLRQAQALIRLCIKYGNDRVDAACRRALAFDVINVKRVERIVKLAPPSSSSPSPGAGDVVQLPFRFQRPAGSFGHQPTQISEGEHDEKHRPTTITESRPEEAASVRDSADAAGSDRLRPEGEAD